MGGFVALLGGAASSLGGAGAAGAGAGAAGAGAGAGIGATAGAAAGSGMAAGAAGAAAEGAGAAIGSGIGAGASAIGAGAAREGAGTAMGAAAAGGGVPAATSGSGVKGFFSQAWDMAKEDIKDTAENNFIVRDSAGNIDGRKTAGKTGYTMAKRAILSSDGEDKPAAVPQPEDMSHAASADTAAVTAPNAEDELNKLRNRINS